MRLARCYVVAMPGLHEQGSRHEETIGMCASPSRQAPPRADAVAKKRVPCHMLFDWSCSLVQRCASAAEVANAFVDQKVQES